MSTTVSNAEIGKNEDTTFELAQAPSVGFTLRLCVHEGRIVLYVATDVRTPNSAKHDLKVIVDASLECQDIAIKFTNEEDGNRKRQAVIAATNTSVFIRIEGLNETNRYTLDTMEGVVCKPRAMSLDTIGNNYMVLYLHLAAVVCDPPCGNGACVANNTCSCDIGYDGDLCTERCT